MRHPQLQLIPITSQRLQGENVNLLVVCARRGSAANWDIHTSVLENELRPGEVTPEHFMGFQSQNLGSGRMMAQEESV